MTLRHRSSLLVAGVLLACNPEPPPEAPPPSGCGPGMTEVALRTGASLCVDVEPVSLASYQECVGRALCSVRPAGGGCLRDDLTTQQQPVNCVDAAQADAFCKAQKKRLPTRQELEATPFGPQQVQWRDGSEWTSTPSREGTLLTLRHDIRLRTFFEVSESPANTQHPSLGFRCVR